jgi:hypothetical protein
MALFGQPEKRLADFEKHLDIPSLAVSADYLFLRQGHSRRDKNGIIFQDVRSVNARRYEDTAYSSKRYFINVYRDSRVSTILDQPRLKSLARKLGQDIRARWPLE